MQANYDVNFNTDENNLTHDKIFINGKESELINSSFLHKNAILSPHLFSILRIRKEDRRI